MVFSVRRAVSVCLVGGAALLGCDGAERSSAAPTPASANTQAIPAPAVVPSSASAAQLQSAIAQGLPEALRERSLAELVVLERAAQQESNQDVSYQALRAVRTRFAGSPEAIEAAYALGELTEDADPGQAATWFETYLREAPDGPHAVMALGRQMMLLAEKDDPKAEDLATAYLDRAPNGDYASEAQQLLAH